MLEEILQEPKEQREHNESSLSLGRVAFEEEILSQIQLPQSVSSVTDGISLPSMPDLSLDVSVKEQKDIFALEQRKSWDKSVEARCDFTYKLRLTRRASTNFITIWQKSVFGKTLTEIKSDDEMIPFFVESLVPVIRECIGYHTCDGSWAIVTTPMRRHKERNFATLVSEGLAKELGIPFYFDCAHCRSKQRVEAVFEPKGLNPKFRCMIFCINC